MAPQRDNRVKVSALLRTGHEVSEVANFVEVSRTTAFAKKKCMSDDEGVKRRAGRGQKTVVDCGSFFTTACTSIDTFAIIHHNHRHRHQQ